MHKPQRETEDLLDDRLASSRVCMLSPAPLALKRAAFWTEAVSKEPS